MTYRRRNYPVPTEDVATARQMVGRFDGHIARDTLALARGDEVVDRLIAELTKTALLIDGGDVVSVPDVLTGREAYWRLRAEASGWRLRDLPDDRRPTMPLEQALPCLQYEAPAAGVAGLLALYVGEAEAAGPGGLVGRKPGLVDVFMTFRVASGVHVELKRAWEMQQERRRFTGAGNGGGRGVPRGLRGRFRPHRRDDRNQAGRRRTGRRGPIASSPRRALSAARTHAHLPPRHPIRRGAAVILLRRTHGRPGVPKLIRAHCQFFRVREPLLLPSCAGRRRPRACRGAYRRHSARGQADARCRADARLRRQPLA